MDTIQEYTDLIGKTFVSVENVNNEELVFKVDGDEGYKFYHRQSGTEEVEIVDIVGDLSDLAGTPIIMAESVTHYDENPEGVSVPKDQVSFTWTFYKFATVKGYVTVRWYGSSNGYYSETVRLGTESAPTYREPCKVLPLGDRWGEKERREAAEYVFQRYFQTRIIWGGEKDETKRTC